MALSHRNKPSIWRIVQVDYIACLAVLFPLVVWVLSAILYYTGDLPGVRGHDSISAAEGLPFFLYMGLIATAIGVPVLVWRVRVLLRLFARGQEVVGRLISIGFFRDRGRIDYAYDYQGRTFQGGNAVMRTGRTTALSVGAEVVLLVDPAHPHRAVIRDLYL
jgi:hypothetical protein